MTVNLSAQNVITFSALIAAIIAIIGYFTKAHDWIKKQDQQSAEIAELRKIIEEKEASICKMHESDIKSIQAEQTIIVYGLLACLKGLKEKGCDGPVSEAVDTLDKYLNKKAHES